MRNFLKTKKGKIIFGIIIFFIIGGIASNNDDSEDASSSKTHVKAHHHKKKKAKKEDTDIKDTDDKDTNDEDDSSVELDYGTEADYSPVDYQKMLRNADDIMGDGVKVVGTVLQIENNKYSNSYCLVEMNGDVDQLVLVRIEDKYYPKNKIIKGDHVTICGILSGTKEYETVLGDENEVPYVDACIKVRNSQ